MTIYRTWGKRIFDVVAAVALGLLLSWLMLLIILIYVGTFQYSVFYTQLRIGKKERVFKLYKFRTLRDVPGSLVERTFWWGSILRFLSLDELPQLWNVLTGDMSLVGPRPLPVVYLQRFSADQRKRHEVRPGITGLAQVSGRHTLAWTDKFKYDQHYVDNISFMLDIRILLRTMLLILSFAKDHSLHEEEFKGQEYA